MAPKGAMGGRLAAAILLVSLLVLPAISASGTSDLSVKLEIEQTDESVLIDVILENVGNSQANLDTDPSCDAYLQIYDSDGNQIRDDSSECRGQSRGLDLSPSQSVFIETLTWDYTDSDGEVVDAGIYEIFGIVAGEEIYSSEEITVIKPITIDENLEVVFSLTYRDETAPNGPIFLTTNLVNTADEEVSLSNLPWCMVQIDAKSSHSCNPSQERIAPHEKILISHQRIFSTSESIEVEISGVKTETLILPYPTVVPVLDEQLELSIVAGENGFVLSESQLLETEVVLTNSGDSDSILEFSDNCRAELWMVDISGQVVKDSRFSRECSQIGVEYLVAPSEELRFTQPDWSFTDTQGCSIPSGEYTLFAELPEFRAIVSQVVSWENPDLAKCSFWERVQGNVEIDTSEMLFEVGIEQIGDLSWTSPCRYLIEIRNDEESIEWRDGCDDRSGTRVITTQGITEVFSFSMEDPDGNELPPGNYEMSIESLSIPIISASTAFEWEIDGEEKTEQDEEIVEEEIVEEESQEQRILIGIWEQVGECWTLDSREEGLVAFSSSKGIPNWSPRSGWLGQYSVTDSNEVAQGCEEARILHIAIEHVHSETPPLVEEDNQETTVISDPQDSAIEISDEVTIAISAVATTGFLALLVVFIAGNESWRIPATGAGLWLLGLIGRTNETSDGRYQRGRLMGYLTANPGCHFRALMAALSMSNGQITHHLKILEEEDKIWRRKDGRLVRFYPLTAELNSDLPDNELPLPPLSPDPNSLQGKILKLLDDDGQLEEYPTQAELAYRLERSQQLISHHLRTLQKYGLVEKKRIGIKQRYSLTKEAVFLLETNEF